MPERVAALGGRESRAGVGVRGEGDIERESERARARTDQTRTVVAGEGEDVQSTRGGVGLRGADPYPLSSECGTYKTVKAILRPWHSGKRP